MKEDDGRKEIIDVIFGKGASELIISWAEREGKCDQCLGAILVAPACLHHKSHEVHGVEDRRKCPVRRQTEMEG